MSQSPISVAIEQCASSTGYNIDRLKADFGDDLAKEVASLCASLSNHFASSNRWIADSKSWDDARRFIRNLRSDLSDLALETIVRSVAWDHK